jgi:quercetin dioxygenase-like cupin family protein
MAKAISRQPGQGDAYWVLGGLYEVKVGSDEANGETTIMEMTVPRGMGPPPHTHAGSESVYVLEGTLRLHLGDEATDLGPGSSCYLPTGTLETFEPTSDTARVLFVYTPGGIEKFFAEIGEAAPRREVPPPPEAPPDFERMVAAGERYGLQFQLPEA